jgi:hypothetical protein
VRATEASNIIWENLAIQNTAIMRNQIKIICYVVLFLFVALIMYIQIKGLAAKSLMQFPPNINCNAIGSLFDGPERYKVYADFDKVAAIESTGSGVYQCYCEVIDEMKSLDP